MSLWWGSQGGCPSSTMNPHCPGRCLCSLGGCIRTGRDSEKRAGSPLYFPHGPVACPTHPTSPRLTPLNLLSLQPQEPGRASWDYTAPPSVVAQKAQSDSGPRLLRAELCPHAHARDTLSPCHSESIISGKASGRLSEAAARMA